MRVVFASHGSLGDLVPFLEVGKVLLSRGHGVRVATHAAHRGAVERAGLSFSAMRPDRPDDPAFHARFMHPRSGAAFAYKQWLGPRIAQSDADLLTAADGADVLVSVTLALAAPLVAARTKMPWRSAAFQPAMLFSVEDPPRLPLVPFRPGRTQYNARLMEIAKRGVESWAAPLRAHRRAEGLGEYPDHPVFGGQHSPGGVLALYSPLFGPLPSDAPPGTVQTGQVLQSGGAPLDPELTAFLARRPVVFTLGSASAHAARDFFRHAVSMADRLGVDALLLVGRRENLDGLRLGPRTLARVSAPYERVFNGASLVVHQGGIGTIALALDAGVPMALVPFAHDQPDNAARAVRTGAARVVPRWRWRWSARAIEEMLHDEAMRAAAARCQGVLSRERGAERAADAIEAAATHAGSS